ncbi:hypothetical protein BH11PLA2_BH11PLA2_52730 [soil metagenome]
MNRYQSLLRSALAVGVVGGSGISIAAADTRSAVPAIGKPATGATTKGTPGAAATPKADPTPSTSGPGVLPDIIQGLLDILQVETDTESQKQITEFFLLLLMFLNQSQVPSGTAPMGK